VSEVTSNGSSSKLNLSLISKALAGSGSGEIADDGDLYVHSTDCEAMDSVTGLTAHGCEDDCDNMSGTS